MMWGVELRSNRMNHSLVTPPLPADTESRTHRAQRIALGVVLGCGVGLVIDYLMIVWLNILMGFLLVMTLGLVFIIPVVLGGLLGIVAARAQRIPAVPWIVIALAALVVAPLGWYFLVILWDLFVMLGQFFLEMVGWIEGPDRNPGPGFS